ncbi:MAG: leucine-rich repeat domain-containing protein, partial [Muribaculaceae bacterium]|nr:leucine-rich repeat domain-containing protein [Muribaculaceae bacterium]
MKRKIFLTLLMGVAILSTYADDEWICTDDELTYTDDEWSYTINNTDRTCEVVGYYGESNDVVIPAKVEKDGVVYTVTSIGMSAFLANGLTSVTLPESITYIGDYAFDHNKLEYVYYNAINAECKRYVASTDNLILGPKVKVAPEGGILAYNSLEFW